LSGAGGGGGAGALAVPSPAAGVDLPASGVASPSAGGDGEAPERGRSPAAELDRVDAVSSSAADVAVVLLFLVASPSDCEVKQSAPAAALDRYAAHDQQAATVTAALDRIAGPT